MLFSHALAFGHFNILKDYCSEGCILPSLSTILQVYPRLPSFCCDDLHHCCVQVDNASSMEFNHRKPLQLTSLERHVERIAHAANVF